MRQCPKCKSKAIEKLDSPSFQERWRCRGCGAFWARAPQDDQFAEDMERRETEETETRETEDDDSALNVIAPIVSEFLSSPEAEPSEPDSPPDIEPGGGDFGGGGASGDF